MARYGIDALATGQGLAGSGDLLARAALRAGIGAWECDLSTDALTWTRGVFDLFGLSGDMRVARPDAVAMYCEDSREAMERLRADAIARRRGFSLDARIRRADGAYRWMRLTADIVCRAGQPTHLYGLKRDITDERVHWDALRRLAEHDALTGLVNRAVFQAQFLDGGLVNPGIAPLGALVLFDIDGFKQINDASGHAIGDACLEAVAERLAAGFSDALMVARIGGDEFAVLCRPRGSRKAIDMQVAAVLGRLSMPVLRSGEPFSLSASAGIAYAADPFAYDAEAMFVAADAALYAAKRAGRNTLRSADTPN